MIRFEAYKDLYVPVVRIRRNKHIAKVVSYCIFKKRKLESEELIALVTKELNGKTSRALKNFIYSYLKKLEFYGLVYVEENGKEKVIHAQAEAFPIKWFILGLLSDPGIRAKVKEVTLNGWKAGVRTPDITFSYHKQGMRIIIYRKYMEG